MTISKKFKRILLDIAIVVVVIAGLRLWVTRDMLSGTAPDFNAVQLNSTQYQLHKSKDKPVLVHFWATWCPVCKLEQESINNIAKDYPVITIAMQSGDDKEIQQFMQDEKLAFKVINDKTGLISNQYEIKGVPVSIIINKDNNIVFTEVGYTTEIGLRLRLWWAGL